MTNGSNIALRNGSLYLESSQVRDEYAYSSGHRADYGLYALDSHVVISDSLFTNNGSGYSSSDPDCGLYAAGASTVTVELSTRTGRPQTPPGGLRSMSRPE